MEYGFRAFTEKHEEYQCETPCCKWAVGDEGGDEMQSLVAKEINNQAEWNGKPPLWSAKFAIRKCENQPTYC